MAKEQLGQMHFGGLHWLCWWLLVIYGRNNLHFAFFDIYWYSVGRIRWIENNSV